METVFGQLQIFDFTTTQLVFTLAIFIWSGFVRSGLGFGGAALALPLMLLVYDQPLFWLPIIGIHLLIFSAMTLRNRLHNVDWQTLRKTSIYIFPERRIVQTPIDNIALGGGGIHCITQQEPAAQE